jgi:hypothetical protein
MVNFKQLRKMIEVKGNGNIISKEFHVSSFIRLHLVTKGLTELIQGDEEKVVIETDENLLEYFEVVNAGRTLYVSSEAKFRKPVYTKCNIKVYLRQINVLNVTCDGGDVICPDIIDVTEPLEVKIQSVGNTTLAFNAPAIKVSNQSQGNVVLGGKCQSIDIKNQSQGNFSSKDLWAQDLTIKNMAEGNIELFAENSIAIIHYGEGYIHYSGNAVLKDVKQFGNGQIKHV